MYCTQFCLIALAFVSVAQALKCFHSTNSTATLKGTNKPPSVDCSTIVKAADGTANTNAFDACVKVETETLGMKGYTYSCGKKSACDGKLDECKEVENTILVKFKTKTCCCNTDDCNGVGMVRATAALFVLVAFIGVARNLF